MNQFLSSRWRGFAVAFLVGTILMVAGLHPVSAIAAGFGVGVFFETITDTAMREGWKAGLMSAAMISAFLIAAIFLSN
jgi:hypothetical protein